MKTLNYVLVLFFIVAGEKKLSAQEVALNSVFSLETDNIYASKSSAIYKDSFVYTIGDFEDNLTYNNTTLTSNYNRGIFLLKTTMNNDFVWLKKIADNSFDVVQNPILTIAFDTLGNVLTAIGFRNRLYFENDSTVNQTGNFKSTSILKLNNQGDFMWETNFENFILGNSGLIVDHNNDILITGVFANNFILKKLDESGNFIFDKTGESGLSIGGEFIKMDVFNNYYCAGILITNNNIFFDTINPTFSQSGLFGSFLVKYNSDGAIQWLKCYSASTLNNFGLIGDIDVKTGIVVISGSYNSPFLLTYPNEGSVGPNNSQNRYGGFLISYDFDGNINWYKKTHSTLNGDDKLLNVSITDNNQIYTTSAFDYTMLVGDSNLYAGPFGGLLLEKYSSSGALIWFYLIEGTYFERSFALKNNQNSIFLFGATTSAPINFQNDVYSPISIPSLFIAKIEDNTLSLTNKTGTKFSSYPNPANDHYFIKSEIDLLGKKIATINNLGQEVKTQRLENQFLNKIELPKTSGIYFIKIEGFENEPLKVVKN